MLLFIIFAVLGYFAYTRFHWPGVAADAVVYVILVAVLQSAGARRRRADADRVVGTKLSEEEKFHLGQVSEHQRKMEDHRAQFDPELRKSRGPQP